MCVGDATFKVNLSLIFCFERSHPEKKNNKCDCDRDFNDSFEGIPVLSHAKSE